MTVQQLDLQVDLLDEDKLKADSLVLFQSIRPDWRPETINWKVFTDGITNKLVGAWNGDKREDTVLIRVYGLGTEKIIDRRVEVENMVMYHKLGQGSKLFATFTNGICYQFLHGEVVSQDNVFLPAVSRAVARGMAQLHTVPIRSSQPVMWERLEQFIRVCNPAVSPKLVSSWATREELRQEANLLRSHLETTSSPVVFCHNDALLANIVIQPNNNEVAFIDLEYGAPNYASFDIANHFCEFTGADGKLDYERWLPSKEYQMDWIAEYLRHKTGQVASQDQLEQVFSSVRKFMLCAHLQWSIWSVIQAENSSLDFDFVDYAVQRFQEYKRWKSVVGITKSVI